MPCPDVSDVPTLLSGVEHRMDRQLPGNSAEFLLALKKSTRNFILKRDIRPIHPSSDRSVDTWLESTNYNEARKAELRLIYEETLNLTEMETITLGYKLPRADDGYDTRLRHFIVKLFAKEECYEGYKQARGIYARDDIAKVFFGPYFKLMETELYAQPEFIKHIPVLNRPEYILEHVTRLGWEYLATDYTSFECHFSEDVMECCEFVLYEHMLRNLPEGPFVMQIIRMVLAGVNRIYCSGFEARIKARRMSGEMCTSLGNGFSNLMFMQTYCDFTNQPLVGVVEGDDGLFAFNGPQRFDLLTEWGLLLKMESHSNISTASFCGMIFDEDSKQAISNPFKIIAKLGWSTRRYARSNESKLSVLQHCKALSILHQYRSCPIVSAFCRFILRSKYISMYQKRKFVHTTGNFSLYEKENMLQAIEADPAEDVPPSKQTRMLFDELYQITPKQQVQIEEDLNKDSLHSLTQLASSNAFPKFQHHFWDWYTEPTTQWETIIKPGTIPKC